LPIPKINKTIDADNTTIDTDTKKKKVLLFKKNNKLVIPQLTRKANI